MPNSATLFERLGGRAGIERIVDAFYARIEHDEGLRPLFPPDLGPGRERQKLFLEQWLGGEERYSAQHGPPMMRRRHFPFAITEGASVRWLGHMRAALAECGVSEGDAREFLGHLAPFARHMVNTVDEVAREEGA